MGKLELALAGVLMIVGAISGALFAWAATSIWPQLPFWPVAIIGSLVLGSLSASRS
jgi:hypothetical protein